MKRIFNLILLLASANLYAQTIDANGQATISSSPKEKLLAGQAGIESTLVYENVRKLTEVNDNSEADAYPWLSPDGLSLYFTRGNGGGNLLMIATRTSTDSNFNAPTVLPVGLANITSCWFSIDELDAYICSADGLFYIHRNTVSSAFSSPVAINLTGVTPSFMAGACLNAAQDKLFLSLNNPAIAKLEVVEFSRSSSTSFAFVRKMSVPVGFEVSIGQLSKDELTFLVGGSFNNNVTGWLFTMKRKTTSDTFDLNTFEFIESICDTNSFNSQPTVSNDLEWVVFIRSETNSWSENELYIAHLDKAHSSLKREEKQDLFSVYPNPANGSFSVLLPTDGAVITITNQLGQVVLKKEVNENTVDLQLDNNGIYFIQVATKQGTATRKLVVNK